MRAERRGSGRTAPFTRVEVVEPAARTAYARKILRHFAERAFRRPVDDATLDRLLPPDSPRGGVLTQASFLLVTSNPARTSPVKRGLFVLGNFLGTPPPPPPANVPPLEDAGKGQKKKLSVRALMELHRRDALCASCHARMDPLGLAMESFHALGAWRDQDEGQPIDTAGQLITGEKFSNARDLARVIATDRRQDVYRCLTEKRLTYALGRGVEYYDAPAVDRIVGYVDRADGSMKMFVYGVVTSPPFLMRRGDGQAGKKP